MGNNCCKYIDYIDEDEEYRYSNKKVYYKKSIHLEKNQNLQLKTIYEEDENVLDNEKQSIDNCIIEVENNEDIHEKYDNPDSYDVISVSNDTIQYASDNSTEIVENIR